MFFHVNVFYLTETSAFQCSDDEHHYVSPSCNLFLHLDQIFYFNTESRLPRQHAFIYPASFTSRTVEAPDPVKRAVQT